MKVAAVEIVWHAKQPVFSVDAHPSGRLATGGADNDVKVWMRVPGEDGALPKIEFRASLSRHSKAVNVVRFSPNGQVLASGGDDGAVILWRRNDDSGASSDALGATSLESDENKEVWTVIHILRSHLEDVCDLAWSPDSLSLLSGSVDNTAVVWDATKGKLRHQMKDHKHYVQGVAWDPLNQYVVTQSSDRSVRIFSIAAQEGSRSKKPFAPVATNGLPASKSGKKRRESANDAQADESKVAEALMSPQPKSSSPAPSSLGVNGRFYVDETLPSFFRRPSFTPDGSLLITPAGLWAAKGAEAKESAQQAADGAESERGTDDASEVSDSQRSTGEKIYTTIVYNRGTLHRPIMHLPCPKRPTVAVRCCPLLFESRARAEGKGARQRMLKVPYRMLFAVATTDAVIVYDTERIDPVCVVSDLHYAQLTDVCWTPDGRYIAVSSQDGYCSLIAFKEGEIGRPLPLASYPAAMLAAREADKSPKRDEASVRADDAAPRTTDEEKAKNADAKSANIASVPVTPPNARPALATVATVAEGGEPRDISSLIRRKPAAAHVTANGTAEPRDVENASANAQAAELEGPAAKKRRVVPTLVASYE